MTCSHTAIWRSRSASDGEGLEGVEVDLVGTVGVEEFGRGVAEAQALLDGTLRHPEAGGDAGDGGAVIGQRPEGLHLVGRVHGDADHVLGEGEFAVGRAVADDAAGHGEVVGKNALAGEVDECGQPPAAGDDGVAFAAVRIGVACADHQVLEQPVRGDGSLELGEGGLAGHGLADVGGRELQPVERDGSDDGIGHVRSSPGNGTAAGCGRSMNGRAFACDHASAEGKAGNALPDALVSISAGARLGLSMPHGPGPDAWNKSVQSQSRESGSALLPDAAAAAASRSWLPSVVVVQSNSRHDRHEERGNEVFVLTAVLAGGVDGNGGDGRCRFPPEKQETRAKFS